MASIRTLDNGFKVTDWTQEINNFDHVYNFFTGLGMFNERGVSHTSISFDKDMNDLTLLPDSSRRTREATKGKERKADTFVLPLAYFKVEDSITPEDVQDIKAAGTEGQAENWARVRAEKLEDMRFRMMITHEYMKVKAAQGISVTPEGTVLANMFTEFGVEQDTVNFTFTDDDFDIDGAISDIKDKVQKNLLTGSLAGNIKIIVDRQFFDALRAHPRIRTAYQHYSNQGPQRLRDPLETWYEWGITEEFSHNGVQFITYNAEFKLPDGNTESATPAGEGYTILPNARDMYRGYWGPSNKLSGVNQVGKQMFAYEYPDPRDEFYDMEAESSPLFITTQPKAIIKVTGTYV